MQVFKGTFGSFKKTLGAFGVLMGTPIATLFIQENINESICDKMIQLKEIDQKPRYTDFKYGYIMPRGGIIYCKCDYLDHMTKYGY